ncbi:hypothetical protein V8C34DRAFT_278004 [Trichoderma compactum]
MTRKGTTEKAKPSKGLRSHSQEFLAFPAELAAQLARAGMSQAMPCKFAPLAGGFCAEPKSGEPRLRHDGTETLGHGWFEILLTVRVSCVCAGTLWVLRFAVVVFFFSVFEVSLLFLRMRRSRAWPLSQIQFLFLSLSLSLFVYGV